MREYGKERKKERDRDCTFVINARQAKVCMWICSRKDKCMWEKLTESIENNLNVSSFEKENKNLFPSALIIENKNHSNQHCFHLIYVIPKYL